MPSQVFCKTERGKAEIAHRSGDLSPAARRVLIMVNGSDSVTALAAQGLPDLQTHLAHLQKLGLIAPMPGRAAAPSPPPYESTAPAPLPAPRPAAPPPDEPDPRIDAQCHKVLTILQQHYGPNAPDVAQAMLMARTTAEFNTAIAQIESRMIGHLGRKLALREMQGMRLV